MTRLYAIEGTKEINKEAIPAELKQLKQWVAWKGIAEAEGKKRRKMPISPYGGAAKSNDPSTWGNFDEAWNVAEHEGYAGIGYEFSIDDPYAGVDIDHCINPATGDFTSKTARELVNHYGTYCEISPSGTGVKLIFRSSIKESRKDFLVFGSTTPDEKVNVETYAHGRFFTVTGKTLPGMTEIKDCTQFHGHILRRFAGWEPKDETTPITIAPIVPIILDDEHLGWEAGRLRAALKTICSEQEGQWHSVLCSIKHWGTQHGRDDIAKALFEEWSRTSPDKYDQGELDCRWARVTPDGGLTAGSIYHEAMCNGWDNTAVDADGTPLEDPAVVITDWGSETDRDGFDVWHMVIQPQQDQQDSKDSCVHGYNPTSLCDIREIPDNDRWLVKGLIPRTGFTLMAAPPKMGKSMLAMDLAIAISHGTPWMGMFQTMFKGQVMYMSLDQDPQLTKSRILKLGADPLVQDIMILGPGQTQTIDAGGKESMLEYLNHQKELGTPVVCVIVDIWQNFASGKESRMNAYQADYKVLGEIRAICTATGTTFFLLHHTNKMGEVSGSTAFGGAPDCIIHLTGIPMPKKQESAGWKLFRRMQAKVTCRWGGLDELGVDMWGQIMDDPDTEGKAIIQASTSPFLKNDSLKDAIIAALHEVTDSKSAIGIGDIKDLCWDMGRHDSGGAIKMSLSRLYRDEMVQKADRGTYYLTYKGSSTANKMSPPQWIQKRWKREGCYFVTNSVSDCNDNGLCGNTHSNTMVTESIQDSRGGNASEPVTIVLPVVLLSKELSLQCFNPDSNKLGGISSPSPEMLPAGDGSRLEVAINASSTSPKTLGIWSDEYPDFDPFDSRYEFFDPDGSITVALPLPWFRK